MTHAKDLPAGARGGMGNAARRKIVLAGSGIAFAALVLTHRPAGASTAGSFDSLLALCLASQPAAHPDSLWAAWTLAPEVVLPLLAVLGLYGRGLMAQHASGRAAHVRSWRTACFVAGWLSLVVALVSPLCRTAATLASAHMIQHVILVAVAPPLLVLGAPGAVMASALPRRLRDIRGRLQGHVGKIAHAPPPGRPILAAALYGAAIWLWHVPLLYQLALLNEAVHLLMYGTLIALGLLYWRSLIATVQHDPGGHGGAVVSSLATMMHTSLLGALLTFAPTTWYPLLSSRTTNWGLTPLEDQQLAGLIMWVPMGSIYLIGSLWLMAAWLKKIERHDKRPMAA